MITFYHADDNFLSKRENHLKKDFQTPFTNFLLIKSKTYQGEFSFYGIESLIYGIESLISGK